MEIKPETKARFAVFHTLGAERADISSACRVYTAQALGVHLNYNFGWQNSPVCTAFSQDMDLYAKRPKAQYGTFPKRTETLLSRVKEAYASKTESEHILLARSIYYSAGFELTVQDILKLLQSEFLPFNLNSINRAYNEAVELRKHSISRKWKFV